MKLGYIQPAIAAILSAASLCPGQPRWEILSPFPAAGDIVSIDFVDRDTGFFITDAGLMMHTGDGGRSWSRVELSRISTGPWALDFIDIQHGWVLGGANRDQPWLQTVYYTVDGGESWDFWLLGSEFESSSLTALQFDGDGSGWAAGSVTIELVAQPVIYRFLGDDNWDMAVLPEGEGLSLNDICFINRNMGWAAGQRGYLARTIDGGRNWERLDSGSESDLTAVSFNSPFAGWAAGGDIQTALILKTDNGGNDWRRQDDHPASSRINDIRALEGSRAVAISIGGQEPAMVMTTADGSRWESACTSRQSLMLSLAAGDWGARVGGSDSYLIASSDLRNWEQLSSRLMPGNAYCIQFTDDENGWCCGDEGVLLATTDGGGAWRRLEIGANNALYCTLFNDRLHGWVTGGQSLEMFTADGGESWQEVEIAGGDVTAVAFSDRSGYAIHGSSVSYSHDGGDAWRSVRVLGPEQAVATGISVPSPRTAYVASPADSLRRTLDGGESWHTVPLPSATCLAVCCPDSEYGWAVAPDAEGRGDLYLTRDGGGSWNRRNSFDFQVAGISFIDRSYGWAWGSSGEVSSTADGGRNWQDMELSVSRMIWSLDAATPDRLWICGSGSLIARWGENWQAVNGHWGVEPTGFILSPISPNPANCAIHFTMTAPRPGIMRLELYDMTGRRVSSFAPVAYGVGTIEVGLQVVKFPSGCYYLVANSGSLKSTLPFTIIR